MSDLYRRYQPLDSYIHCYDCDWDRSGLNRIQAEAQATGHATETGHQARVILMAEIIFRAQPVQAVSDA